MNRFASLLGQLTTHAEQELRLRLLADYIAATPEPDRSLAAAALTATLGLRKVRLALIRGLAEQRVDPVLFELSRAYVGDVAEAIALAWPCRSRANRDPSLGEIVEAVSTLGKSELPKRIEAWLDACDADGRFGLIKLLTGTLRAPIPPQLVRDALAAAGLASDFVEALSMPMPQQHELFHRPATEAAAGSISAVLMYVERANPRATASPLICTFGVWRDDALVPVGKAAITDDADAVSVIAFVEDNTLARFGPVREVAHAPDMGLVLEVAFEGLQSSPRHKSGIAMRFPRINRLRWDKPPQEADTIDALASLLPPR